MGKLRDRLRERLNSETFLVTIKLFICVDALEAFWPNAS